MSRKVLLFAIVIIAVLAAGVFVAAAQDDETNTPPFGFGRMHQNYDETSGFGMMGGNGGMMGMMGSGHGGMMGMMGKGHGGMMGGQNMMGMMAMMSQMGEHHEAMTTAIATALGLEVDAFTAALNEGQTLAEIAEAQGVELEVVFDAMIVEAETHMAALVEAGTLTQEEVDAHLTWMRENIETMPMFTGAGFGPCMGGAPSDEVTPETDPEHEEHHSS